MWLPQLCFASESFRASYSSSIAVGPLNGKLRVTKKHKEMIRLECLKTFLFTWLLIGTGCLLSSSWRARWCWSGQAVVVVHVLSYARNYPSKAKFQVTLSFARPKL